MRESLKEAVSSGHKASSRLKEVLQRVSLLPCPEAYGFDGLGTYPDCGECIVCVARDVVKSEI